MNFPFRIALCLASSFILASPSLHANTPLSLDNPGFEDGMNIGWDLWVAPDSQPGSCHQDICTENPHSGTACLKLSAEQRSRFCIGRRENFRVQAGERYRISVWMRGNADCAPDSPGVLIRLSLETPGLNGGNTDLLHIGLNGKVTRNGVPSTDIAIPAQWTLVSSVVEIPTGVTRMQIGIFLWNATGTLYLDDFSLEKVDATTPLSETTPESK